MANLPGFPVAFCLVLPTFSFTPPSLIALIQPADAPRGFCEKLKCTDQPQLYLCYRFASQMNEFYFSIIQLI